MNDDNPPLSQWHRATLFGAVVALALLTSATGIGNGFAMDDLALVADNARVHSLDHWWRLFALPYWPPQFGASLYRPAVTLGYAIQWSVAGGSPLVFHLTSVALYTLTSVLVLALFLELLAPAAAFVGAALFAVHPVHVEAVANVVGQSELLAATTALGACVIFVRARRRGVLRFTSIAWIGLLYLLACLSKEHAVLLPVILAMLEWFGVGRGRSGPDPRFQDRARATAPLFAPLAVIGIALIIARTLVVGELLGEKHLVPVDGVRRLWALLVVVPHWLRLLTWPAHLTADYSPRHIEIPEAPGLAIVPGASILIAVVIAVAALGRRSVRGVPDRGVACIGLAWLAITLLPVSNLFSVMLVAERTLLMPSVGAMLVTAAGVSALRRSSHEAFAMRLVLSGVTACLVLLGLGRSATRAPVWRDDATLFAQTVEDAPRSYRAQFLYGQMLFDQGRRREGERRLRLAIALNPTPSDVSPLNYLATQYRTAGLCAQALPLYERALSADAQRPDVRYGLAECLLAAGRVTEARQLALDGARRGSLKALFLQLVARADSATSGGS